MARAEDHKCLFCGVFFHADARNAKRQKYCSAAACRQESKAASRRAWLSKAENQDYFRGPENVGRVQAWRAAHPGYWRRARSPGPAPTAGPDALQDLCPMQVVEIVEDSQCGRELALQDLWRSQPAVLIGFIAQFTGTTLQDDIASTTWRLIQLGHDILAGSKDDDPQTCALSGADPSGSVSVQLGGPPAGARTVHRAL